MDSDLEILFRVAFFVCEKRYARRGRGSSSTSTSGYGLVVASRAARSRSMWWIFAGCTCLDVAVPPHTVAVYWSFFFLFTKLQYTCPMVWFGRKTQQSKVGRWEGKETVAKMHLTQ